MYEIFSQSDFKERRKVLRKNSTPQELKLWYFLKGKNMGSKWRRQQGIGPYIADFYCKEKYLVIELDGSQHIEAREYDKTRDEYFKTLGIQILRFWNNEIDTNMEAVLEKIRRYLTPPA
jgi:very-short-patch-repair endonuclease